MNIINIKKSLMVFFITSTLASLAHAHDTEVFFSTNVSKPNLMFVLDVSGSMSETVPGSGGSTSTITSHTIDRLIANASDDAEQASTGGQMFLNDRYLDIGYDHYDFNAPQRVGLRFYNTGIPEGAVITNAYIQFEVRDVDQWSNDAAPLTIFGEASDNAARFGTSGSTTINARTVASNSVSWNPPTWARVGDRLLAQRTSDLSPIVQDIVDRGSWSEDNGMVFIIEATPGWAGSRVATSFNASTSNAPTLHVEYDAADAGTDLSRLEVMQRALRRVLEVAPDNVNVGIMKFSGQTQDYHQGFNENIRRHYVSGVGFPISDINALAEPIIGDYKNSDNLPNPNANLTVREFIADIADDWYHSGGTPIVDSLYEAALYFRGEKMHYGRERNNTNATSSGRQLATGSHRSTYVGGAEISKTVDTHGRSSIISSNYISPIQSSCQSNYIVLMSDGQPTYYRSGSGAYYNGANKGPFALSIKGTNKSTLATAIPTCPNNNYGFRAGTCGSDITKYIASHDNSTEHDGIQTIKTYSIGFGSGLSSEAQNYIRSLETIDDDPDTASVVEDGYFNADSPEELARAFRDILDQVSQPTGTLASPGYSVNVKSGLEHEKDIYIPVFDRKNSALWSGNLKKFTIKEVGNQRLIRGKNDLNAVDTLGGFTADAWDWWSDTPTDDGPDGAAVQKGGVAGKLTPENRLLVSNLTKNTDLTAPDNLLVPSNKKIKDSLLEIEDEDEDEAREKLINFIRGWKNGEYDNDATPKGVARKHMGDMLHSEPLIITYDEGNAAGDGKKQYIFAATNEGYLHAFDTDTGEEKFAFMPKELLKNIEPQFRNEGTAEDHKYGVDGSLTAWDHFDKDGNRKIYLYFGLRRGGNSYYALDVTDINRDDPKPKFLWKASYDTMGESWSIPYLGRIRHSGSECRLLNSKVIPDCKEVVVISGGYDVDEDRDGEAASKDVTSLVDVGKDILILGAEDGDKLWSLRDDLDDSSIVDSIPGGVRILDTNKNGLLDRFYFADTGGNVWRLDLDEVLDDTENTTKLTHLASLGAGGRQGSRKFYNEPDVSLMKLNGKSVFIVSIGSGFRAHPMDLTIDDKFYMLIDDKPFSAIDDEESEPIIPVSKLAKIKISTSGAAKTVNQPNGKLGTKIVGTENDYYKGWEVSLPDDGEKILGTALAFDGVIVFTTLVPQPLLTGDGVDQCAAPSSQGRLYGINIRTGESGLDLNGSGDDIDDQDIYVLVSKGEIPGAPQVVVNSLEVKDVLDGNGDPTGNSSCRHPVDVRIGKKLSQATGYDACRLESLYWSDPVERR